MQRLPIIDLTDCESSEVCVACRDVGFMYVLGHGISPKLIESVRRAVTNYFSQSGETKYADVISRDNYRGYIPQNFFSAAGDSTPSDCYEGFKLHFEVNSDHPIRERCDLYGPNKWPDIDGFRESILAYWRECDRVTRALLQSLSGALQVEAKILIEMFDVPLTNMTLLHYPPTEPAENVFGIHPHKDTDALTILAPDPVGGLMVKSRDSDGWIDAKPHKDALIVNIGDLLELWSGGYFVSTPHKVVNTSGEERYSFPYFAVPRYDTVVEPLREPQIGFERGSVHVGDVSREVWRTNWPDVVPDKPQFDLGTLED
ncbi:MAG: isopenicillin N synthase family dioxygenase [Woeseiaceae bacterium]